METLDHLKRSDREGDHYNDDTDKVSERNEADRSLVEVCLIMNSGEPNYHSA